MADSKMWPRIDENTVKSTLLPRILEAIVSIKRGDNPQILPLLGSDQKSMHQMCSYLQNLASTTIPEYLEHSSSNQKGKTDPKNIKPPCIIVEVPAPSSPVRTFLHFYTIILQSIGADILKPLAQTLINSFGGKKKLDDAILNGIRKYPGVYADLIKCFCILVLDKGRSSLAERWLLGEDLDEISLDRLGVNMVIESNDICLAALKLIGIHLGSVLVLDLITADTPLHLHGPEVLIRYTMEIEKIAQDVPNIVMIISIPSESWPKFYDSCSPSFRQILDQFGTPLRIPELPK